mmetsp:Transcript_7892/g.15856  ORF Transcript_7892/g.15856 Transcript_7892/m.15856 type:complete len:324 (+) Transcript_7892:228-1199(+)
MYFNNKKACSFGVGWMSCIGVFSSVIVLMLFLYIYMDQEHRSVLLRTAMTRHMVRMVGPEKWERYACEKQKKCVFLMAMGRSGSTALQDAMNQLPGVFIRGENHGMFKYLFNLDQTGSQLTRKFPRRGDPTGAEAEKTRYHEFVKARNKPAWYSNFEPGVAECAKTSYFKRLFGYGDFQDYTVGFKEIRHNTNLNSLLDVKFASPWTLRYRNGTRYKTYDVYIDFFKSLCTDSKIIFNLRRQYNLTAGQGFYRGRGKLLERNIRWMHRYAQAHGKKQVHFVYYEDMFDPAKNETVLRDLARFLGISDDVLAHQDVSFSRLPRI